MRRLPPRGLWHLDTCNHWHNTPTPFYSDHEWYWLLICGVLFLNQKFHLVTNDMDSRTPGRAR